jgi:hypothetical protein
MSEYEGDAGYSSESGGQSSEEDEDVAIEFTPQADEAIEVSMDDLMADGYQPEQGDDEYIA